MENEDEYKNNECKNKTINTGKGRKGRIKSRKKDNGKKTKVKNRSKKTK